MARKEEKNAVKIPVLSNDPKEKEKQKPDVAGKDTTQEMSQEDVKLKENLELLVERVQDPELGIRQHAIEALRKEISSSTTSMTSIPKPLKFLHPHYKTLKKFFNSHKIGADKPMLADVLSCLAMTMAEPESLESLKFKLQGASKDIGMWGHEYVRHLTGEVGEQWLRLFENDESYDSINPVIDDIIQFDMAHNAEADACDLLMEVDKLELLPDLVTRDNHNRVCLYLLKCSYYVADTDELQKILTVTFDTYLKCGHLCDALRVAIKMDDKKLMTRCFNESSDKTVTNQLAFILGSHKLTLNEFDDNEELMELIGNARLNEHFLNLAQELNVQEAKSPEDIYKSHLVESQGRGKRGKSGGVDSAKENLASTFVNAFVHAGFGKDLLMTPEDSEWLYKNKEHGMLSATASLGLILLWDLETGFSAIDKFSFSSTGYVKAGALFATGMLSCGVTSEMDAAVALLGEHVEEASGDTTQDMQVSAIMGLGLAYAGTGREDVLELLSPVVSDSDQRMEIVAFAALSLGLVFVGTCNDEACGAILQAFCDRSDTELEDSNAKFLSLGLALLYLGKGEDAEAVMLAVDIIEHPIREFVQLNILSLAYTATGNVLKVQELLKIAGDHPPAEEKKLKTDENAEWNKEEKERFEKERDEEEEKAKQRAKHDVQPLAVIGIALIALGEDLGVEMAYRAFDNLLQYGAIFVRRSVPLALGMLCISNPNLIVMETLSKLTHDQDEQVSQNAILALGLIGAGTNNSRVAKMLRQLAAYYKKEPNHLFLTRISQGLVYLGKGLLTLNPFHSDNLLLSKTGLGGILVVLFSSLAMKNTILSKQHYLLYYLVTAMRPRMLITLDEELNPLPVSVRVGQAVDTVRQAGKPRTITGFQTHTTPVLLARGERAELATDKYIPVSAVLEGFIILKKNPDAADDNQ